jgi:hypothetical protein
MGAEIIIFVDENFGGLHTHLFHSISDLSQLALFGTQKGILGNWNDQISSFKIVSGTWSFFKNINFGPAPLPFAAGLGPGEYPSVEKVGIDNDSISSISVVSTDSASTNVGTPGGGNTGTAIPGTPGAAIASKLGDSPIKPIPGRSFLKPDPHKP